MVFGVDAGRLWSGGELIRSYNRWRGGYQVLRTQETVTRVMDLIPTIM